MKQYTTEWAKEVIKLLPNINSVTQDSNGQVWLHTAKGKPCIYEAHNYGEWSFNEADASIHVGRMILNPSGWKKSLVMRKEEKMKKKILNGNVFPSTHDSIFVEDDYPLSGAHDYMAQESLGFKNGEALYSPSFQTIRFVKKLEDGTIIPGLQSEQLALILIDRHKKLNDRFPSDQNQKMVDGLEMFLEACRERVEDRINRNVMGKLKK